jgi:hypothetical protein
MDLGVRATARRDAGGPRMDGGRSGTPNPGLPTRQCVPAMGAVRIGTLRPSPGDQAKGLTVRVGAFMMTFQAVWSEESGLPDSPFARDRNANARCSAVRCGFPTLQPPRSPRASFPRSCADPLSPPLYVVTI